VDYLAEILRHLRNQDYSDRYKEHFRLSADISTRDRDAINKTFSGLMKILFPNGGASEAEVEEILQFAMEGRKRVKDQLFRIDPTYAAVNFSYSNSSGEEKKVRVLEELEYSKYYDQSGDGDDAEEDSALEQVAIADAGSSQPTVVRVEDLPATHVEFRENQKGASFDELIVPYLRDASKIVITDPYIRLFYQIRNLMELLEGVVRQKREDEEVEVELITVEESDSGKAEVQREKLDEVTNTLLTVGVKFSWKFVPEKTIHARHIVTDTGWKVSLDRGLDIFQYYDFNDQFSLATRNQNYRPCKAFEITYIRV
jgi:ATP-dependent Lon protease